MVTIFLMNPLSHPWWGKFQPEICIKCHNIEVLTFLIYFLFKPTRPTSYWVSIVVCERSWWSSMLLKVNGSPNFWLIGMPRWKWNFSELSSICPDVRMFYEIEWNRTKHFLSSWIFRLQSWAPVNDEPTEIFTQAETCFLMEILKRWL